ncbi:hypothetical protein ACFLYT_00200 [Nanoarchaeota archaeon]
MKKKGNKRVLLGNILISICVLLAIPGLYLIREGISWVYSLVLLLILAFIGSYGEKLKKTKKKEKPYSWPLQLIILALITLMLALLTFNFNIYVAIFGLFILSFIFVWLEYFGVIK